MPSLALASVLGAVATQVVDAVAEFTVTFNGNEANGGSMEPQTSAVPANLTPNGFSRTGYTFGRWNVAADDSGTNWLDGEEYAFDASITLYAIWSAV